MRENGFSPLREVHDGEARRETSRRRLNVGIIRVPSRRFPEFGGTQEPREIVTGEPSTLIIDYGTGEPAEGLAMIGLSGSPVDIMTEVSDIPEPHQGI